MIATMANIPLAIGSVVVRRFIDSYTGRLPLAIATSPIPSASTVAFFSGALFCLYHQLRKGTLVKIGIGRKLTSILKHSRHTIQRRVKNNSWFLRNIAACRRKCTEAVFRIARQSNDSLRNIRAETGTIAESNSLPIFKRCCVLENRRTINRADEPPLEKLYSRDCSKEDLEMESPKRERQLSGSKRRSHSLIPNRPITRNYRKRIPEGGSGDRRNRISTRKRKKSERTTDEIESQSRPVSRSRSEGRSHLSRRDEIPEFKVTSKLAGRRFSERLKRQPKFQKVTRRTRSGRVYVYRL